MDDESCCRVEAAALRAGRRAWALVPSTAFGGGGVRARCGIVAGLVEGSEDEGGGVDSGGGDECSGSVERCCAAWLAGARCEGSAHVGLGEHVLYVRLRRRDVERFCSAVVLAPLT